MTGTAIIVVWSVWCLVVAPGAKSALPPEARVHNIRGSELVLAGEFEAGVAELELAYAAMPDPVKDRVGRGKVLGSLRGALRRYHVATGALEPLCRMRAIMLRHRDALLAAPGSAESAAEIAGVDGLIQELDATPEGRSCAARTSEPAVESTPPPAPQAAPSPASVPPPVVVVPRDSPPPLHPTTDTAPRGRLRVAGGVLLGFGGLAFVGAAVASGFYGDRYRRLDALDRQLDTPEEIADWERLHHEGRQARVAAAVAGAVAGVLIVAGVAVLTRRPGPTKRASLAPAIGTSSWGIRLVGRF